MTIQNDAKKSNEEKYVEEKAERFMIRCPGFPPTQLDRLKDFIRTIINDCKPKVSKARLKECVDLDASERYLDIKALMYELGVEILPRETGVEVGE